MLLIHQCAVGELPTFIPLYEAPGSTCSMRFHQGSAALLGLAMLVAACNERTEPEPEQSPPVVEAAQEFLSAVRGDDCESALTYLSADSQFRIEEKSRELARVAPSYAEKLGRHRLNCEAAALYRFRKYHAPRLKSQAGQNAIIAVERREPAGFLVPGFWSTRTDVYPAELQFVEEDGGWKVVWEEPPTRAGPARQR